MDTDPNPDPNPDPEPRTPTLLTTYDAMDAAEPCYLVITPPQVRGDGRGARVGMRSARRRSELAQGE